MKAKLILLYFVLLPFSFILGQQVTIQLSFSQKDLHFEKIDNYDFVRLTDGNSHYLKDFIGKPQLGIKSFNVLIPPNCEIKDIKYKINSEEQLKGKYFIYPVQHLTFSNEDKPQPFADPDPLIYNSKNPYPENITKSYSLCVFRDYSYANVSIIPFKYVPSEKDLFLLTDITIIVEYKQKVEVSKRKRQRAYNEIDESAFESVKKEVINQNDIYTFYSEIIGKLKKSKSTNALLKNRNIFSTTAMPSTTGSEVKYVIITNNYDVNGRFVGNLSELFQDFADWKTKTGMPAKVIQIDDIKNHYSGCDIQEKIREFIKDAYSLWGTEYVLLGGDANIVPARLIPYGLSTPFMPSDLYYSDIVPLDNNWNDNGNNVFCEDEVFGDHADQIADIMVGRAPIGSVSELNTFLNKNYSYYRCSKAQNLPDASYLGRQLNLGGIVSFGKWDNNDNSFGLWVTYKVWELRDPGIQYTLMEYKANYPSDWAPAYNDSIKKGYLRANTALTELNKGYGIISHIDHSDWNCLGAGAYEPPNKEWITSSDIMQLNNGKKCGILYSAGCRTAPFDMEDCVGEKWLLNNNGGGVAFIGTATEIYSDYGGEHNRHFFQKLTTDNIHTIGDLLFATNRSSIIDKGPKYDSRIFQLLSDPELQVFTTQPNNLTVSYNPTISVGKNAFEVTVSGIPVGLNARICLMKNNEVYEYSSFENGTTLFDITLDTPGQMYLTVTAPNCQPYEGVVNVTNTSGAHLYVTDVNANDCKTYIGGACNGNGDGQIDAGETIELVLKIKNSGPSMIAGAQVYLNCSSSYITIYENNSVLPAINSGQEVYSNAFSFYVTPNARNGENILFFLSFIDINGNPLPDEVFYLKLSAPKVDLAGTEINDGGDGIQAGETIEFNVKLNNKGNSVASGINAVLESASPNVGSITQSTSSYSNIAAFSEQYNQQPFRFVVSNSYSGGPITFSLNVTDGYGKTWPFVIDLTRPSAVTNIIQRSFQNEIELTWTEGSGVKGYNVYRSQTIDGLYTKLNKFIIEKASLFRDYGLSEKTIYYYKISSVSNSGVESSLSAPIKAWTLLPMLANWPIAPSKSGIIWSGITLSDVDNDGYKEIFTDNYNGMLLAWKHDGTELFDIDNNSATVSGFYDLNGKSLCSVPVIADIDKDGKKEIVVTTRNPGDIYVFKTEDSNADGKPDIMPGWPQHLDNGDANLHGAVISDLNGDGYMEIIAHSESGPVFKVLNHDGSNYTGWPKTLSIAGASYGMPAAADLDNDGYKEIIEGFADGNLYIWRHDGSNFKSNPFVNLSGQKLLMPPVVADIDKDGSYEIFVLAGNDFFMANLYAFTPDGNIKSGWNGKSLYYGTVKDLFPCITVGDLDQNGTLEVVYASGTSICVWDANGNNWNLPGQTVFPITNDNIQERCTHPLLADIDGDNQLEIIVPTLSSGNIYAFKCDGSTPVGWPLPTAQDNTAEPAIDDIDNDGKSEIVIGDGSGQVYVYKTDGNPSLVDVGHYRFNNQNTGVFNEYAYWEGTLSRDTIWSGNVIVGNNFTIPGNVTLTINPGTNIIVGNGHYIDVFGTLLINGTSSKKVTFDFIVNNDSTNNGIRFYNGSAASVINWAVIKNAHYGMYMINTSPSINNTLFKNNYLGIYCYNNANPYLVGNVFTANLYGLYCSYYSAPILAKNMGSYYDRGQNLFSGDHIDIFTEGYSFPYIGISPYGGYNSFYPPNSATINGTIERGYNIFTKSVGTLYAQNNWWLSYWAYIGSGKAACFRWLPWIDGPDPNESKRPKISISDNLILNQDTLKSIDFPGAYNLLMQKQYESASNLFEKILYDPLNEDACSALINISDCYKKSGKKDFIKYLISNIRSKFHKKDNLYLVSLELENFWLINEGKYNQVVSNYKQIRDDYSENNEVCMNALFNEFYLNHFYLKDEVKAKEIIDELIKKNPDDILTQNAKALLKVNSKVIGLNNEIKDTTNSKSYSGFLGNYPNPFNPITTIKYSLPKISRVELTIYNILGEKIRSFQNSNESAGVHSFIWNGLNSYGEQVASGIYIYRLKAFSIEDGQIFEKSSKMIMMK